MHAEAITTLIAPQAYLDQRAHNPLVQGQGAAYDLEIPYEALRAWLLAAGGERASWRANLIGVAAGRGSAKWRPTKHITMDRFRADYFGAVSARYPHLRYTVPGDATAGSTWGTFAVPGLTGARVYHKINLGVVDLSFDATEVALLAEVLGTERPDFCALWQTQKSAVMRVFVPVLDFTEPLTRKEPAAHLNYCLDVVDRLVAFGGRYGPAVLARRG